MVIQRAGFRFASSFAWASLAFFAAYYLVTYLALYFEQSDREGLIVQSMIGALSLAVAAGSIRLTPDREAIWRWRAELVIRTCLAYMMLFYGSAKLFPGGQFTQPPLVEMDQPYYLLSPFWRAWGFFAHSAAYNLFLAMSELVAGILLMFERTKRLAVCLLVPILANVAIVNYAFGINVLYVAVVLLFMAMLLFASELRWFVAAFWTHEPFVSRSQLPSGSASMLSWTRIALAVAFVAQTLYILANYPFPERPVLYGIWQVHRGGSEFLTPGAKLYIDEDAVSHIRSGNALAKVDLKLDEPRHRVELTGAGGKQLSATYAQRAKELILTTDGGTRVELQRLY